MRVDGNSGATRPQLPKPVATSDKTPVLTNDKTPPVAPSDKKPVATSDKTPVATTGKAAVAGSKKTKPGVPTSRPNPAAVTTRPTTETSGNKVNVKA